MTLRATAEEVVLVTAAAGRCAVDRPVAGDLDWSHLLTLARWNRLVPLLGAHVRDPANGLTPPAEVVEELRAGARDATARSLSLHLERDRALEVLAADGIPVMLLKGAALVEEVYEHPGHRPMLDLDLLVPRASVQAAHDAVQRLGYRVVEAQLDRDDDRRINTIHHHFPLVKGDVTTLVELHHGLFVDRLDFDVQGLWDRARPSPQPPTHLLPAPEDLLLHVAVHFAFDRIQRGSSALGQLGDVVRIVERWDIDWDAVVQRAVANRVADRLFLGLDSVELLVGDVVPATVLDRVRPPGATAARSEAFVRQRVLTVGPSIPLEQLSGGVVRRLFPGYGTLEHYVRPDELVPPSRSRLRVRRARSIARRAVTELRPRQFVDDLRLSRWLVSLRD